jgi:hypothetical protein
MSDTPDPNTHFMQPKITGYRKLSAQETELINEGKALAEQVGAFIHRLRMQPPTPVHGDPFPGSIDQRWVSIGATQLQQGFMALIRGIAQPSTF